MKTIIAGTDFTPSSLNACHYAALLAQKLKCKLVIFNLFEAPILHSNSGLYGISFSAVKKTSEKSTQDLVERLHKQFPTVKIQALVASGSFKEELENFIGKHQVEAVVMGLEAKGRISKYIWGSHGVDIAGKINAPAIIVPEKYREHHIGNFLVAMDSVEKLRSTSLKKVEQLLKATKGSVKFLHVRTPDEVLTSAKDLSVKINNNKTEVETQKSRTIEEGIRFFCRDNAIDLVTIISRQHSVFYNLFRESITKKVAFSAKVPVMAIHE